MKATADKNYKDSSSYIEELKSRRLQTSSVANFIIPDEISLDTELVTESEMQEIFTRKIEDNTTTISSKEISHIRVSTDTQTDTLK